MRHWTAWNHHVRNEENAQKEEQRMIPPFVRRWSLSLSVALLGLVALLGASPAAHADPSITLSGSASSVNRLPVPGGQFDPVQIYLPPGGSQSVPTFGPVTLTGVNGQLSATSLTASSSVSNNVVRSQASLEHLNLSIEGNSVTVEAVTASAEATCVGGTMVRHTSTAITGLRVNGVTIPVTGGAQAIPLPNTVAEILLNWPVPVTNPNRIITPALEVTQPYNLTIGWADAAVSGCPSAS